jgi:predicted O-methyltransferase YrrM
MAEVVLMTAITTASQTRTLVGDTGGGTTPPRGERIHNFVRDHAFEHCLELGFAHGVGSVYIASALEANGRGHLTSVDVPSALDRLPLASDLLEQAGLAHRVSLVVEPTSYTWFLHRILREQLQESTIDPLYDFVFIDGAHTWDVDGFAFLLVDKLLKPGGWILFDDLYWRLDAQRWPEVPDAQRAIAQVNEVWDLLVLTHPGYDEMRTDGSWGWAHKATTPAPQTRVVTEVAPLLVQLREVARFARARSHV